MAIGRSSSSDNLQHGRRHKERVFDAPARRFFAHAFSPLLGPLLDGLGDVFEKEVLSLLDPTDLAMLARVGCGCRDAVRASGLPRAGVKGKGEVLLQVRHFTGSVERLAWAKANGCPWTWRTCALVAGGGQLEVLSWAREHARDSSGLAVRPECNWRCF
mmetsp:Transcript_662/g.1522  ORF Transcript_662/g.1522 Transcript_662/m.1522 type:complete len:159 (+) Transcript_662:224-700(+)